MSGTEDVYLTTRELADLLRIKERKVYDLVNNGDVPCVRVVGKLLFPRAEIMRWIIASRSGPVHDRKTTLPPTVLGSHDPLLDWALRESGCGLASFFDGSLDGLQRLLMREGVAAGAHIYDGDDWNVQTVKDACGDEPVVMIEFCRRERGLIVLAGNPMELLELANVAGCRVARRHAGAASQQLFEKLLDNEGLFVNELEQPADVARTEDELGLQVFDERVDAAFGLRSVAKALRLDFVPQLEERFDLVVWRHAWFETPFQTLLEFTRSDVFQQKAEQLGGYDVSRLGAVRFNAGSDVQIS